MGIIAKPCGAFVATPTPHSPRWKTGIVVWIAIYPSITLLPWLAGPWLHQLPLMVQTLAITGILVSLLGSFYCPSYSPHEGAGCGPSESVQEWTSNPKIIPRSLPHIIHEPEPRHTPLPSQFFRSSIAVAHTIRGSALCKHELHGAFAARVFDFTCDAVRFCCTE